MLYTGCNQTRDQDRDQIQTQTQTQIQTGQTAGPDARTSEDCGRMHSRQQQITAPGTGNSTRENPKHLMGTTQQTVSTQL
jgi:hypothetical protein